MGDPGWQEPRTQHAQVANRTQQAETDRGCAQDLAAQLYNLELLNAWSRRFLALFYILYGFFSFGNNL